MRERERERERERKSEKETAKREGERRENARANVSLLRMPRMQGLLQSNCSKWKLQLDTDRRTRGMDSNTVVRYLNIDN